MLASIIIADDHPLILKGLNDFLIEKNYNVLGCAENGVDAFHLIAEHKPDIAVLDIQMPGLTGLEVAKKCIENKFTTRIILITFEKDITIYKEAKALHIYGYILKEFALIELEICMTSIMAGTPYFSPEMMEYLEIESGPDSLNLLTPAEIEILKLIAQNNTAKEIGSLLFISSRTVEKHKSHIIKKLNLESKGGSLALYAKENQVFLEKNT